LTIGAPQRVAATNQTQQENSMKTLRKTSIAAGIGAALALGTALAASSGPTVWTNGPTLVGTWRFEMTVRVDAEDCSTSEPITFGPNPFPGLASFHEGGTMTEYASRTGPSIRTTGFGSWEQTALYRYEARHTFMEFDETGALWRNMEIESKIVVGSLYGNHYKAVSRLRLSDVSGNVVKLCATIEGDRLKP
jgi:hypothetical protein